MIVFFEMKVDSNYNGDKFTILNCGKTGTYFNPDNIGYVHGICFIFL